MGNLLSPIFGTGRHGTHISSSNEDITTLRQSCSITAGSNQLTVTDISPWTVGDLVYIHKSMGSTNAWEFRFARVLSKSGVILTLDRNIDITFTDSGYDQSQAVLVMEFTYWKINSGILVSPAAWDNNIGGISIVCVQNRWDNLGEFTGIGKGYLGAQQGGPNTNGARGGNYNGAMDTSYIRNGTGGGGGDNKNSAAGGGHKYQASNGPRHFEFSLDGGPASEGGAAFGNDALSIMGFGGGGGAGARDGANPIAETGDGGASGAILWVLAPQIDLTSGWFRSNGQDGGYQGNNHNGGGGGGSGGTVRATANEILNINNIQALGGAAAWGCAMQHSNLSTAGSIGRTRIEVDKYSGTNSELIIQKQLQAWSGKVGIL